MKKKPTTLTYCKALPQLSERMNALGCSDFEMFLFEYSQIFRQAKIETVTQLRSGDFNKGQWNTYLQQTYGINKRHANGVIASAKGAVDSAAECRQNHIEQLSGKFKSAKDCLRKAQKRLANGRKFYAKKNWQNSKTGCKFPLSCSLRYRDTNWQNLRFQIHHKKRYIAHLERKIEGLKVAQLQVKVPYGQVFVVGSKDETWGNQVCQWDGETIRFRVPKCLESKYGQYVSAVIGDFDRNINRLPDDGSRTWHFYRKDHKWVAAVQFTPAKLQRVSQHSRYGCIGIDLNPSSVGWAYVDADGNLKAHGQIPLQQGLPSGKQDAQIVDACLQLVTLAKTYQCPIVHETLDFGKKKEAFRELGRKYARMLSGWAYSRFFELLNSICSNRGVYVFTVNPAYSSLIGMVKYARMYGLASDEVAALVIARRGMGLSERLPSALTALIGVNPSKHVWYWWNQLNKQIQASAVINRRHDYYSISNWGFLVKPSAIAQ
ncbi:MAG: hypothetical protein F6K50_22705 [Moorea sp. SIO3I7]|uniref:hypothetical protein n=1 Tax=unclassified Moorena TaxID=2683338 RepID=UPI0013BF886E|nr:MULTISPECIES: hypothetical protein [unclassified Moorena]NEN98222.1 hypothetical protein [Moorena sp. SIO3I7]NEO04858.1 hypothetical protein [Moorena sp. SIO3I8]NEO19560.1 hypothetical protein [Moorena sp. SIO4A5]NEQ60183.1 hypothetical protein [Moorena sp. SIO4A1]